MPHSSTLAWKIPWTEEPGAAVHGVAKSQTWLSNFTFTFHFHSLEKEMAIHSSVLAWRILGTGEPGGLPSMGSHRVGHDWSDLAAAAACMEVRVGLYRKLSAEELMLLNCDVGEDSWESPGLQGDQTSPSKRKSVLNIHWKDWCWKWSSNSLATLCEELTHWKRPWCWERLKAGGEVDDREWDGWMASPTRWTWVWASFGSWWRMDREAWPAAVHGLAKRHEWVT